MIYQPGQRYWDEKEPAETYKFDKWHLDWGQRNKEETEPAVPPFYDGD